VKPNLCPTARVGLCAILAAALQANAASVNPLISPPPIVKAEPSATARSQPSGGPQVGAGGVQVPGIVPTAPIAPQQIAGQYPVQSGIQLLELPPEKWLSQAVVTSVVGERASILVPLSLNEAQAANSGQINGQNGLAGPLQGANMPNFGMRNPVTNFSPQGNMPAAGAGQAGLGTANQPQTAVQQSRQDVLYVRSGQPFFFKGERFSVEISGKQVTIWRPVARPKAHISVAKDLSTADNRDIIFVGEVSSTEMSRRAVISQFAPSDPAVLKRITPTYGASGGSTGSGGSAQSGGANSGDPNFGAAK